METPGSSPPSRKKQKVSSGGGVLDQHIELLNDVTAGSGVDLREEGRTTLFGFQEWEQKQAENEKLQNPSRLMELMVTRRRKKMVQEDQMRTTAANAAVRASIGGGDMLSRWQLMIEAKQKQGGSDKSSTSPTSTRNTREDQKSVKRDCLPAAWIRKVRRNQVVVPRVAQRISLKDMIVVLEREPQMSKSKLLYGLYNKVSAVAGGE